MTNYRVFNFRIGRRLGIRIGFTVFFGRVLDTIGFNNDCKECHLENNCTCGQDYKPQICNSNCNEILFWDLEKTTYISVLRELTIMAKLYYLSHIHIFKTIDKDGSYRAICTDKIPLDTNRRIIMQTPNIDFAFVKYYMRDGRKTIRLTKKGNIHAIVHTETLIFDNNIYEKSYPHQLVLNKMFNIPILKSHDDHKLSSIDFVKYETVNWGN